MTQKNKNIIRIGLFSIIFLGLLLIGTFYDLEISHLLAGKGLDDSSYYSNDFGGRIIEYIGSFPIFVLGIFACLIFTHKVYSLNGKKKYLSLLFIIVIIILTEKLIGDTIKYYCRFHNNEAFYEATSTTIILYLVSIILTAVMLFFYRKVNHELNNKLVKFAYVIVGTCIGYLLIELIKSPVGRMRYRAMNLINNYSFYTPWYKISDAKHILSGFDHIPHDGYKSFPSGHTFSAGVCYALICMPYVVEKFNNKKWKTIWYIIPVCYTGLVGFYRIVVGAHYLTDVLVGGTIAYVLAETFKYFIYEKKNQG